MKREIVESLVEDKKEEIRRLTADTLEMLVKSVIGINNRLSEIEKEINKLTNNGNKKEEK
ncbi:MAG: hypothetical protein H8D23_21625 [Candidatus Brocadiales bacterium]|nr:hypothetical protein [Candidatus Brocadiales bacterium]